MTSSSFVNILPISYFSGLFFTHLILYLQLERQYASAFLMFFYFHFTFAGKVNHSNCLLASFHIAINDKMVARPALWDSEAKGVGCCQNCGKVSRGKTISIRAQILKNHKCGEGQESSNFINTSEHEKFMWYISFFE